MADTRVTMWRTQPMQQQQTGPTPPVVPPVAPAPTGSQPGTPQAPPNPAEHPAGSKEAVLADLAKERDKRQAAEQRARDYDTVMAELQQYRDKNKSAEDKQAEALASATSERDAATVKALRYEVCAQPEINLPLAAAQFLTGTTQAEIEASAKALKSLGAFGGATPPATPGLPPSPNAGNEPPKVGKSEAGLAKARERFGDLVKK